MFICMTFNELNVLTEVKAFKSHLRARAYRAEIKEINPMYHVLINEQMQLDLERW